MSLNPLEIDEIINLLISFIEESLPVLFLIDKRWYSLAFHHAKRLCQNRFGVVDFQTENFSRVFAKFILPEIGNSYDTISIRNWGLTTILEFNTLLKKNIPHLNEQCSLTLEISEAYNRLSDKLFPSLWRKSYMTLHWERLLEQKLQREINASERKELECVLKRTAFKECSYQHRRQLYSRHFREFYGGFYMLTTAGRILELTWYFQMFQNVCFGEPKLKYCLSITDEGDNTLELATFDSFDDGVFPEDKKYQLGYVGKPIVDVDDIIVKLDMKNLEQVMTTLGISTIHPVVFYHFIGVLLQEVDFPMQTTIPDIDALVPNLSTVLTDQHVIEFGLCLRLLKHKYAAMQSIMKVIKEKMENTNSWPHFFNYEGKDQRQYFAQLQSLALSLHFLDYDEQLSNWEVNENEFGFEFMRYVRIRFGDNIDNNKVFVFRQRILYTWEDNISCYDFHIVHQNFLESTEAPQIVEPKWFYQHPDQITAPDLFVPALIHQELAHDICGDLVDADSLADLLVIALGYSDYITEVVKVPNERKIFKIDYEQMRENIGSISLVTFDDEE